MKKDITLQEFYNLVRIGAIQIDKIYKPSLLDRILTKLEIKKSVSYKIKITQLPTLWEKITFNFD